MTAEISNVERRIREWHASHASEGHGPNAEAIRQGLVDHWWDINDLLAEIDRLRSESGSGGGPS